MWLQDARMSLWSVQVPSTESDRCYVTLHDTVILAIVLALDSPLFLPNNAVTLRNPPNHCEMIKQPLVGCWLFGDWEALLEGREGAGPFGLSLIP